MIAHGSGKISFRTTIFLKSQLNVLLGQRVRSIRTLVAAKQHDLDRRIITCTVRDHKSTFLATDVIQS